MQKVGYMPRWGVPFSKSVQNGKGRKARTPVITGVLIVVPWVGIEPTLPKELDFELTKGNIHFSILLFMCVLTF